MVKPDRSLRSRYSRMHGMHTCLMYFKTQIHLTVETFLDAPDTCEPIVFSAFGSPELPRAIHPDRKAQMRWAQVNPISPENLSFKPISESRKIGPTWDAAKKPAHRKTLEYWKQPAAAVVPLDKNQNTESPAECGLHPHPHLHPRPNWAREHVLIRTDHHIGRSSPRFRSADLGSRQRRASCSIREGKGLLKKKKKRGWWWWP